jgi:hypothetical protein
MREKCLKVMPQSGQSCGRGKNHAGTCRSIESVKAKADATAAARANRENPHRVVRQWIADYKMSVGCADCGYREHPEALEFDHLPGAEKVANVSKMYFISRPDELRAEMEKCEVVCSNCHAVRTYKRRRNNWVTVA